MSPHQSQTPRTRTSGLRRASLALATAAGLTVSGGMAVAASAPDRVEGMQLPTSNRSAQATQRDAIADFVMDRDGVSRASAEAYLDAKADKQDALETLEESGVEVDGAYFKGERLVVMVDSDADARAARSAGLTPSRAPGQSALDARAQRILAGLGADRAAVASIGADVTTGAIQVRTAPGAKASVVERLSAMSDVEVTPGDELAPHADVVPGRIMDLVPGSNCSLGYPGKTASGDNVLLTAGHCVEGLPDIYDANATHIGKGVNSRFRSGASSVDMGLMDIDSEDVGRPYVDARNGSTYAVKGLSKGAIGSEICKAGNTTGWTCGYIKAYNRTVNYGGTYVSGLAEASVCSEGGDSGGAYLGAGNLAQGMTSGGPVGVECGYNQGHAAGSYSYYQPVVDAANYYGVTIDTM